ncbi:hypothetical protein JXI42_00615 [bacterium]|nr:hypothetical protein [bacterium]
MALSRPDLSFRVMGFCFMLLADDTNTPIVIIQPFLTSLIFTMVLGNIAKLPTAKNIQRIPSFFRLVI